MTRWLIALVVALFAASSLAQINTRHFGQQSSQRKCRFWCTEYGRRYCCRYVDQPHTPVLTKPGKCERRSDCPSTRLKPEYCSQDGDCGGDDKCCPDVCLNGRSVCKLPVDQHGSHSIYDPHGHGGHHGQHDRPHNNFNGHNDRPHNNFNGHHDRPHNNYNGHHDRPHNNFNGHHDRPHNNFNGHHDRPHNNFNGHHDRPHRPHHGQDHHGGSHTGQGGGGPVSGIIGSIFGGGHSGHNPRPPHGHHGSHPQGGLNNVANILGQVVGGILGTGQQGGTHPDHHDHGHTDHGHEDHSRPGKPHRERPNRRPDRERPNRRPDRERPDRERPNRRPDRERPDRERPNRRPDREREPPNRRPDRERPNRRPDREREERPNRPNRRPDRERPNRRPNKEDKAPVKDCPDIPGLPAGIDPCSVSDIPLDSKRILLPGQDKKKEEKQ